METWLCCTITPGQFTGEYAVMGQQADGRGFSLFAPEEYVDCEQAPEDGQQAEASLMVEVWEEKGDIAVVRLPQQTLENGQFVTVRADQLQRRPQRPPAQAVR